jgi:hypothetical protein
VGTKWRSAITDRLRLDFEMDDPPGMPTKYSLNLSARIGDDWETLVRYDNAHGTPHRHTFHPDGSFQEHQFLAVLPQTFFAQAQKELKNNAEAYLEEYERKLSNMNRGVR